MRGGGVADIINSSCRRWASMDNNVRRNIYTQQIHVLIDFVRAPLVCSRCYFIQFSEEGQEFNKRRRRRRRCKI